MPVGSAARRGWLCALLVGASLLVADTARAQATWDAEALGDELSALDKKEFAAVLKAAKSGDARSQFLVGLAYEWGYLRPKDTGKALEWHTKAAEQGIGLAEAWVGDFYFDGIGIPVDNATAASWYRRAQAHGYAYASGLLGDMEALGLGTPANPGRASAEYAQALAQGHEGFTISMAVTSSPCAEPLCIALGQAVVAGRTDFLHLRGAPLESGRDTQEWSATLMLPDAQDCKVFFFRADWISYSCRFPVLTDKAAAEVAFEDLVRQVDGFLPTAWIRDRPPIADGVQFAVGPPEHPHLVSVQSWDDLDGRALSLYVEAW